MIQDPYLITYILSYLVQCGNCNKYILDDDYKCCICKTNYCDQCKVKMRIFYGFYENKYCQECELYFRHS